MAKLKGFIGPSYPLRSPNYEAQRTINWFPEKDELGTGKEMEVAALIGVPGLTTQHLIPRGPVRALYQTASGNIYAVSGNGLFQLTYAFGQWSHLLLATLSTSVGFVQIQDGVPNTYRGQANLGLINQVVVVDGSPQGLCFQYGTTVVYQINSATGYPGSQWATFQDGYFLFSQPGTISAFYAQDPLNISALDVMNVNLGGDLVTRVISDHDILWVFGQRSSSVWQNTGGGSTTNVFQQIPGSKSESGCLAPATIQQMSGQMFWLTSDDRGTGVCSMILGYRSIRVSNHAVELWLSQQGDLSGASAWTYSQEGHQFYCLNVPGASTTWAYDFSTQMWSERCYWGGAFQRDLVQVHQSAQVPALGKLHLCGSHLDGSILSLDEDDYTHAGVPIHRVRTSPQMSAALKRVFYSSLQLDLETGVGLDGLGLAVQVGTSGTIPTTATNVLVQGQGPVYTLVGNDGLPAIPTGPVTLSATNSTLPGGTYPNWSLSYTYAAPSTVTVNPASISVPYFTFGTGDGATTVFPVPSLAGKAVTSTQLQLKDWRGTNTLFQYPQMNTNLCQSSQDFNYGEAWAFTGCNAVPSSWATYNPNGAVLAQRPTSNSNNGAAGATFTTLDHAYDATGTTVKTSGTSATISDTYGSYAYSIGRASYAGFGTGAFNGTINVAAIFTSGFAPGTMGNLGNPVSVSVAYDTTPATSIFSTLSPTVMTMSQPLVVKDLSTLVVTVSVLSAGGIPSSAQVYDIVLLSSTGTFGAQVLAPDGTNTGTFLTEDTSNGLHFISTTYPIPAAQTTGFSVYALLGDPNRYITLSCGAPGTPGASFACFNLSNGTVAYNSTPGTPKIYPLGNNVNRLWIPQLDTVVGTGVAGIYLSNVVGAAPYLGNGSSVVGIWGAQIDNHGFPPYALVTTEGTPASEYVTFDAPTGTVTFNAPPALGALAQGQWWITDTSFEPTEYLASFTYAQAVPVLAQVGQDPQLLLSYSDDGGHTFSEERPRPMGRIGDHTRRAIWRRLGNARSRCWRVTCSDPVKANLIGCEVDAK
jgi:hypothetical protein